MSNMWMVRARNNGMYYDIFKKYDIESNSNTRRMYKKLGIEARPKGDFI